MVKNPLAKAGDAGSSPGSGGSPGEGNSNPLQYSSLGNSMDRGACQATVLELAKELDEAHHIENIRTTLVILHLYSVIYFTYSSQYLAIACFL